MPRIPQNLDPEQLQKHERLKPPEVSVCYRISESTLAKWRHLGIGPAFIRVSPRKVLYETATLDAWFAERTRTSTAG